MSLSLARAAADAVLYEGYLLYPYRSTAAKNQVRWQFGVLGPPGAAVAGLGEEDGLAVECLLRPDGGTAEVTVHLRFLHLQRRQVQRADRVDDVGRGRRGRAGARHLSARHAAPGGAPGGGGRRR